MPPDDRLPPELLTVSREEFRQVYAAAARVALAVMKSRPRADELVSDTFEKLFTTRRWDPAGGKALLDHVLGIVRSERSNQYRSKAGAKAAEAHEGFHREEAGTQTDSPETKNLERAEEEEAQADAETELEALEKSVAGHALATRVLGCRRAGKTKAADVAAELGVRVGEVYLANDVLRDHLRKIRKRRQEDEGEKT